MGRFASSSGHGGTTNLPNAGEERFTKFINLALKAGFIEIKDLSAANDAAWLRLAA